MIERYGKGNMNYEIWVWELSWGKINMIWERNGLGKNMIDEVFMLYQSI
jgi:hypothetical protein